MTELKLRFKEFNSRIETKMFKNYIVSSKYGPRFDANDYNQSGNVKTIRGTDVSLNAEIKYQQVPIAQLPQNIVEEHKLHHGDLLMITTADCGLSAVFYEQDIPYIASAYAVRISLKNGASSEWFKYYLQTTHIKNEVSKYIRKGTISNLPLSDISKFNVTAPSLEEQTKIASFLSAVDEKISQFIQKHQLLSQYKQGMMQKLFSQQIRFKADDGSEFGEWEDKPLNEIASKRSGKNKDGSISEVLTNSATQGIIKQSDYFEREIVTKSNLNGYYIVNLDDFVYNPRISVHAPVGPIKRNKKCLGVMSPLYTVFTVIQGNLKYLEYFFDSNFWHDYVQGVANSGARHDRMNITNKDFFDMPILYPCLEEQTKIANFLSAIDQKIELEAQQIEQAKTWKKGLLQQMFV